MPLLFRPLREKRSTRKLVNDLYAVCLLSISTADSATANPKLQKLLAEFSGLFQEPDRLPPAREVSHHINLKEGNEPVNVRPYRYAYFQKAEIEKQVDEMITSGLI